VPTKLAIFISFIFSIQILFIDIPIVQAAQEEQVEKSEKSTENKDKIKPIEIETPISTETQNKNDLSHYLSKDKVITISAGTDDYITLMTKYSSQNNKGVAILLPDWHQSATNPKAINFLRTALPKQGWTTIAIQPANRPSNYPSSAHKEEDILKENKEIIDNYKNKLSEMFNAVVAETKKHPGIVIIIAQGVNGAMLVDLYDNNKITSSAPNALILLSAHIQTNRVYIENRNTEFAQQLAKSSFPVLDLSLKRDNQIVTNYIKLRQTLAKQEMKVYYRHRELNNSITGYYPEQELLYQINSWLKSIGW